ncbi:MAG: hypothetical protein JRI46_06635 [Deltaproteobacteria bacterium]|nr:hypothetical protein [Deltaproteobacteria bacterium]
MKSFGKKEAEKMDKKKWFIFLLATFVVAGSAAKAAEPAESLWWEVKSPNRHVGATLSREEIVAAFERPKSLILRRGKFPLGTKEESAIAKAVKGNKATVWIRNPEGAVSQVNLDSKSLEVTLPTDIRGLYLIGAHVDAEVMDFDSDGESEKVHFYSKQLVYHFKRGGRIDPKPDVFFKGMEEEFPLEIGPFIAKKRVGGGPFMGSYQTALKEHKMKIFYRGQPLGDTEVAILTESGWRKSIRTDSDGIILITPLEGLKKDEKYLYVVTHKDPLTGEYHCSSLVMSVVKPPPEWLSKAKGFILWAVLGTGLFVVVVVGTIYLKQRRDRWAITKFDGYKIKKD